MEVQTESAVGYPRVERVATALVAFVLNTLLPYAWGSVVYFGFQSNYTNKGFTRAGFIEQYSSGIYQHRVISPWLVLKVHDLIKAHGNPFPALTPNVFRAPGHFGEPSFYQALFLHNTAVMILASWALWFALSDRPPRARMLPLLVGVTLMSLTQYVVVPYDTTAWLVLIVGAALSVRRPTWTIAVALAVVAAFGTAVRETLFFLPGFYLAVHWGALVRRPRRWIAAAPLLAIVAGIAVVYGGLRWSSGSTMVTAHNLFVYNVSFGFSQIALIALLGVSAVLVMVAERRALALRIFALSIPVLVAMLCGGNAWEMRLWTPMWLLLLVVPVRSPDYAPASDPGPTRSLENSNSEV